MAAIVRAAARRRLLLPRPAASRPRAATPTRHLSSAAAGPAADDELDPYHGWTFFGPPPPAIYCIGLNYKRHAAETGLPEPRFPVVFMKPTTTIIEDGQAIEIPSACAPNEVDWEVELAVVIGTAAKNVPVESALDYVRGYTVANDVSARRWQGKAGGSQWCRAKAFDTFCPLGPRLVPAAEIPDPNGAGGPPSTRARKPSIRPGP